MTKEKTTIQSIYLSKAEFSKDTSKCISRFRFKVLGTGVYTGGKLYPPITSYYFELESEKENNIIFYSDGTGDIGPNPFEFSNKDFVIEMSLMSYNRKEEEWLKKMSFAFQK